MYVLRVKNDFSFIRFIRVESDGETEYNDSHDESTKQAQSVSVGEISWDKTIDSVVRVQRA